MSRMYTVVFDNVSVSAIQDFFELTPADDKPIELIGLMLSQTGVADIGDAAEEILPIKISRGFTASGSGGSAPTPSVIKVSDTAAGFTAEVNNTTVANTGTETILMVDNFNVRAGYMCWFPPGAEPSASQANTTMTIRLTRAPADAITLSGTAWVREVI
jgi:hypothetical protein